MFVYKLNAKNIYTKNLDAVALSLFGLWRTFCVIFFIMTSTKDMVGCTFNGIECVEFLGHRVSNGSKYKKSYCLFKCHCGLLFENRWDSVRAGDVRNCPAHRLEYLRTVAIKHNMSHTPEYKTWSRMIERCYNKNCPSYKTYKSRGVSDEWRNSFEVFYIDMGKRPSSEYSIDRIDNSKGYYKENCRWASRSQQARNTSKNVWHEHSGIKMINSDWASYFGIVPSKLSKFLKKNTFDEVYNRMLIQNGGKLPSASFDFKILKNYE